MPENDHTEYELGKDVTPLAAGGKKKDTAVVSVRLPGQRHLPGWRASGGRTAKPSPKSSATPSPPTGCIARRWWLPWTALRF